MDCNDHHSFKERLDQIKLSFHQLSTEERYRAIIEWGKKLQPLSAEEKKTDWLVKGCQSTTYLITLFQEGRLFFKADSEALISKGLVAITISLYQGLTPEAILKAPKEWPIELELALSLSPGRYNGLASMIERIYLDAKVYAMLSKKV